MAPAPLPDYYLCLEIPRSATHPEIKAAYRRLALLHHPDKNIGIDDATTKFQLVCHPFPSGTRNADAEAIQRSWRRGRRSRIHRGGLCMMRATPEPWERADPPDAQVMTGLDRTVGKRGRGREAKSQVRTRKLPRKRLLEQKLREKRLPERRLPEQRLPEQRLPE